MTKLSLISFLFTGSILILLISFLKTHWHKRWLKKINSFGSFFFQRKQKLNPYIDTDNWELHKLRLKKFRTSQYKGVTFFVSSEGRIYYVSENAIKVYC